METAPQGRFVQLPRHTAVWVLAAHAYALVIPASLVWVVAIYWTEVVARTDYPSLLFVAAGLMFAGGVFEVAQNSVDKWYLTPACASAKGTGWYDMLFYTFITASQACVAVACMGSNLWVATLAAAAVFLMPIMYMRQQAQVAPLAAAGVLATGCAWLGFGDPLIFLQLLISPLTIIFFDALLKTQNQLLHACTTVAASSGVVFLAAGIAGGIANAPTPWPVVAGIALLVGLLLVGVRPRLLQLQATPRLN